MAKPFDPPTHHDTIIIIMCQAKCMHVTVAGIYVCNANMHVQSVYICLCNVHSVSECSYVCVCMCLHQGVSVGKCIK